MSEGGPLRLSKGLEGPLCQNLPVVGMTGKKSHIKSRAFPCNLCQVGKLVEIFFQQTIKLAGCMLSLQLKWENCKKD